MKNFGESLIGLGIMGCIFFWFIYDPTVSMPSNPYSKNIAAASVSCFMRKISSTGLTQ